MDCRKEDTTEDGPSFRSTRRIGPTAAYSGRSRRVFPKVEQRLEEMLTKKSMLMSEKEREDLQRKQDKVKEELLGSGSGWELLQKADMFIEEEWLTGKILAVPGNIYRIGAFGRLGTDDIAFSWANFWEYPSGTVTPLVRYCGWASIWFLQMIGPPSIFIMQFAPEGAEGGMKINWQAWHMDMSDWKHIALTKLITILCINIFCLSGLLSLTDEMHSWARLDSICRYMSRRGNGFEISSRTMLYMDALTNIWVIFWCCCMDSVVVIGSCPSAKSALFNSLALFFLYYLDDISSGLGLVTAGDWPGKAVGWIYQEMVVADWEAGAEAEAEGGRNTGRAAIMFLYRGTIFMIALCVIVLPIATAITPFLQIAPQQED